jgi:hypothetical protein
MLAAPVSTAATVFAIATRRFAPRAMSTVSNDSASSPGRDFGCGSAARRTIAGAPCSHATRVDDAVDVEPATIETAEAAPLGENAARAGAALAHDARNATVARTSSSTLSGIDVEALPSQVLVELQSVGTGGGGATKPTDGRRHRARTP